MPPSPSQRSALRPRGDDAQIGYGSSATTTCSTRAKRDPALDVLGEDHGAGDCEEGSSALLRNGGEEEDLEGDGISIGGQVWPENGHNGSRNEGLTGQILSLALPALVSLSVDPLMSAVDTAYIGRLGVEHGGGEVGLGALGLNTYIFTFAFYVFGFLATVPTPFVASARAKGDEAGAATLVGQLLTSALACGLVLMLFLEACGPSLLHLMGSTPFNEAEALSFLRPRALSAPAVLIMTVGNGAFRGYLDTKTPLLIALGANAVNFILDPFLIFKLGLGVQGAAIATVAAEWVGALAFLQLLGRKDPVIRLQGLSLPITSEGWRQTKDVATSSAAVFGRTAVLQAALSTASAFAARVGPTSIAAHQVASQLWVLLSFAADSLAVSAQGLIADRMGVDLLPEARVVAGRVLLISFVWGTGLLVVFQVLGGYLPLIFTSNEQVLHALGPVITVVGLMQPINTYVYAGDGVLQGSQDFVYEALTMALSASVGAGFIVSRGFFGQDVTLLDVWFGLALMQGCRAMTFSVRHWLDPRGPLALESKSDALGKEQAEEDA